MVLLAVFCFFTAFYALEVFAQKEILKPRQIREGGGRAASTQQPREKKEKEGQYTIRYYPNGFSSGRTPALQTQNSGTTFTISGNTGLLVGQHIKDGIHQRFLGWNTDARATTALYAGGERVVLTQSLTLHAIFTNDSTLIGKIGPGGGMVYYAAPSPQEWGQYREVAPSSTEFECYFGKPGQRLGGGSSRSSREYAKQIVKELNDPPAEKGRCAQLCDELFYGGKRDWYMPNGLSEIYHNLIYTFIITEPYRFASAPLMYAAASNTENNVNHMNMTQMNPPWRQEHRPGYKTSTYLTRCVRDFPNVSESAPASAKEKK